MMRSKVEGLFSQSISSIEVIKGGYLNRKWKVSLADGKWYFVKQYDEQRNQGKWSSIERSLSIQAWLNVQGVACPRVYPDLGQFLITLPSDDSFAVMDLIKGVHVMPGKPTELQMYHWGEACGKLHFHLQRIPATTLHWVPKPSQVYQEWSKQYQLAKKYKDQHFMTVLNRQKEILDSLDFSLFTVCRHGWAHWDMSIYNVLFNQENFVGVVDFDRMRYVYPELDVGRAILSGCLVHGVMDKQKVNEFLRGYQAWIPFFKRSDLARAWRLIWVKESTWWLRIDTLSKGEVPQRFLAEIIWLQDHWKQLEEWI
ncbi:homoserine kinase type II [Seinonella peptonophila]|uniref:Homoserine kinase type II n=1 Tax=Seinonella peptonophila TaxID=112248 RepID=A0A1M4XKW8_9BACL|nr:phosphotransferase [Seinonella peptonophila]SHE93893.1 homoserine kinase type II [Seinonella peptonophila]